MQKFPGSSRYYHRFQSNRGAFRSRFLGLCGVGRPGLLTGRHKMGSPLSSMRIMAIFFCEKSPVIGVVLFSTL